MAYKDILLAILESFSNIDEIIQGIAFDDFINNRRVKISIVSEIELLITLIAGNKNEISDILNQSYSNILSHLSQIMFDANLGINDVQIWKLIKTDFPRIKKIITEKI